MRILVLLQHYHTPDCATAARPYALVQRLAEEHTLTVITSDAWRDTRQTRRFEWMPDGVRHIELSVPYRNAMGVADRLRSYFSFAVRAIAAGLRGSRPDLVVGSSTPLTAAAAADVLATRWGVPWVFEVQDLWPTFPIQMGAVPPVLANALQTLEQHLYRRAAHIVTVSPDMERHVQVRSPGTPVETIPYGSDLRLLDRLSASERTSLRDRLGLPSDRRIIFYAGSFGRANAIPALVAAAEALHGRSDLTFVFAGDGYHRPTLQRAARRLSNTKLLSPQPYWRTLTFFQEADLSVVPFVDRPVLRTNAPSKLFDSLAAGTPVVVTSPGWTKSLVERHGCGWYVSPTCTHRLGQHLDTLTAQPARLHQAGERAARFARAHLSRRDHMDRMAQLLRGVRSSST